MYNNYRKLKKEVIKMFKKFIGMHAEEIIVELEALGYAFKLDYDCEDELAYISFNETDEVYNEYANDNFELELDEKLICIGCEKLEWD